MVKKDNVMTVEDLMNLEDEVEQNEGTSSETNEEEFHVQFIRELKKKELIEKLKLENNN